MSKGLGEISTDDELECDQKVAIGKCAVHFESDELDKVIGSRSAQMCHSTRRTADTCDTEGDKIGNEIEHEKHEMCVRSKRDISARHNQEVIGAIRTARRMASAKHRDQIRRDWQGALTCDRNRWMKDWKDSG